MNNQTITRADLSQAVYEQVGLSRNESADLVETVLEEICKALERGELVKISSFGTFQVRGKRQRVGRNPNQPGSSFVIPARATVKFKSGKIMRQKVAKLSAVLKREAATK